MDDLEYANITQLNEQIDALKYNADVFFLAICGILVYLMQGGFAFLEAGSVRSKNVTNILIKNLLDSCFSAAAYWACGFAFAYGKYSNPFIGYHGFFSIGVPAEQYATWWFQYVFAAATSTIVSGAMAERCEFSAYMIYSTFLSGFLYPVLSHWAWDPSGWLLKLGYVDFAGSGVVHLCGGVVGFVGAAFLGPRIGRFAVKGRTAEEIKGHSVPFTALGGFILIFGFFAFNGGTISSISQPGDGIIVARAVKNTILSGAWACMFVLFINRMQRQTWSLLSSVNGTLAGMVAICSGVNVFTAWAASVVGMLGGIAYLITSWLVALVKVDDPLDAVAGGYNGPYS